jgi:hypothetical protein
MAWKLGCSALSETVRLNLGAEVGETGEPLKLKMDSFPSLTLNVDITWQEGPAPCDETQAYSMTFTTE